MKEISGIATDSSTTDRPGIDAMCATVKKKKIWKLWKKHSLCPLFSLCEWKSTVAREYLYNTTNSSLKRCLHRQMLLRTLSLFAHIQPVSYDLFTPLNCPFTAPLKKIFHLCFFFPHRDLISCSHTLSLYHSRNRLWFAPPASPCSEDEGSEPPLPIPCMLPLPRG